jgi:chromosome segregation ATPase
MKLRLLSARPAVTRLNRRDARGAQLESVAAEFALLAQRRARLARQLDLLARQLDAANGSMNVVQARMGQLAQRMDQIDPALRPASEMQELIQGAANFQNVRKVGGGIASAGAAHTPPRPADPSPAVIS